MSISRLSAASVAKIEASEGWRMQRVEVFELPEGRVIVKGQRPLRGPWRHRILNVFAALLRVPMLMAVPVPGAAASQALEVSRLESLSASGLQVPHVLHVAPDYFVMSHLGFGDMAGELREHGFAAFDLWKAAAQQLLQVHAAGHYLSQCFSRNIIVASDGGQRHIAGVIDFEDDPAQVMSVLDAQVRDWLIFFQSTLHTLAAPPEQLQPAISTLLEREQPHIREEFFKQSARLVWLRHLPRSRERWGKDVVNLQAATSAIYEQLKQRMLVH